MSRLIKSTWVPQELSNENKVISIKTIKSTSTNGADLSDFVSFQEQERILSAAREEAQKIILEAQEHANENQERMLNERNAFNMELQLLAEKARQEGFSAGFEEGRQAGFDETREFIENAREIVNLSKFDYIKRVESGERTILTLALKVAEKIIGESLTGDSEQFLPIVKRALKEAREYREIQLHVHPNHYEFLLSQKEDLIRIFPKETELYIYPDMDLTEQSCIIESANGRIDASVDQQLDEIKRKLFDLLESE